MPRYKLSFFNAADDAEPARQTTINAADRELATDIAKGQRLPEEERVDVEEEQE